MRETLICSKYKEFGYKSNKEINLFGQHSLENNITTAYMMEQEQCISAIY